MEKERRLLRRMLQLSFSGEETVISETQDLRRFVPLFLYYLIQVGIYLQLNWEEGRLTLAKISFILSCHFCRPFCVTQKHSMLIV